MSRFFKVFSIIYSVILIAIIPALFIANFLVGAAGHNRSFTVEDYMLFGYLFSTATLLMLYFNTDKQYKLRHTILFFTLSALLMACIGGILNALYDYFIFPHNSDRIEYMTAELFILGVLLMTIIVFIGVIRKQLRRK